MKRRAFNRENLAFTHGFDAASSKAKLEHYELDENDPDDVEAYKQLQHDYSVSQAEFNKALNKYVS